MSIKIQQNLDILTHLCILTPRCVLFLSPFSLTFLKQDFWGNEKAISSDVGDLNGNWGFEGFVSSLKALGGKANKQISLRVEFHRVAQRSRLLSPLRSSICTLWTINNEKGIWKITFKGLAMKILVSSFAGFKLQTLEKINYPNLNASHLHII